MKTLPRNKYYLFLFAGLVVLLLVLLGYYLSKSKLIQSDYVVVVEDNIKKVELVVDEEELFTMLTEIGFIDEDMNITSPRGSYGLGAVSVKFKEVLVWNDVEVVKIYSEGEDSEPNLATNIEDGMELGTYIITIYLRSDYVVGASEDEILAQANFALIDALLTINAVSSGDGGMTGVDRLNESTRLNQKYNVVKL